jgi:hypothetical protein
MTPIRINDEWFVRTGHELAGPFKSNSDAWRWIVRQSDQPVFKAEQCACFSAWIWRQDPQKRSLTRYRGT